MKIASTVDEDPIPKEEMEKLLTRREKATVEGCLAEMDIMKQKMELLYEKLDRMTRLYMTLQNQFEVFNRQRIAELNLRVNGGPTVSLNDDADHKSSH